MQEQDPLVGEHIVSNEGVVSPYVLVTYIAGGSFGKVYQGVNENTRQKVAVKLERDDAKYRQLYLEFGFYMRLGRDCKYAPRIHYFGTVLNWNALVMDMLGPSLQKLMEIVGCYSTACTAAMGISFFRIFADFHAKGLIFRDVKPENFLVGRTHSENAHSLYLIDLGLVKEWRTADGNHIPLTRGKPVTGTLQYMSSHMHLSMELSRRDDLEAILYMLIYLHNGTLPWVEAESQEEGSRDPRQRIQLYGECKLKMSADEICVQMSSHFKSVFKLVRKLEFEEEPDYDLYIKKFDSILANRGMSMEDLNRAFDWDSSHKKRPVRAQRRSSTSRSQSPPPRRSHSKGRQSIDLKKKKKKKNRKTK